MYRKTFKISGMHCRSCEILIEDKLREIKGIKDVRISYKTKSAEVYSKFNVPDEIIKKSIIDAGYEIGLDNKDWFNKNWSVYSSLLWNVVLLYIFYIFAKQFGLFNIGADSSKGSPSGLTVVLLVGLTAGFSTCMALVGGLILGISAKHAEMHPEATTAQKFRPHLFFNLGRILSYLVLGGVIGSIGKVFQLSGSTLGILTIMVGIVMLTVGLQLTELFPKLSSVSFTLPAWLSKLLGIKRHHNKEYSHGNSMVVGALTFFLPCGFTQAMQLYAMSTGNFWSGALIMGTFALGTAPGLLGIGGFTSFIKGAFAKKFFRFAGVVVTVLAFLNISNGMNLAGINPFLNLNNVGAKAGSTNSLPEIVDGVQIVKMKQLSNKYSPNQFTIRKGIPVKWIITSEDPNSCAASIYSSKLNISKRLKSGDNVFNFTANELGKIPFSCSMGMYRGTFDVVENDSSPQPSTTQTTSDPSPTATPDNLQIIKSTYKLNEDIVPKEFTIKAGVPARFEVYGEDDGYGCMASITIPKLSEDFFYLEKGKTVNFNFTAEKKGNYYITCAMGSVRGVITAN